MRQQQKSVKHLCRRKPVFLFLSLEFRLQAVWDANRLKAELQHRRDGSWLLKDSS